MMQTKYYRKPVPAAGLCIPLIAALLLGCSIRQAAFNSIANTVAPFPAAKNDTSAAVAALTGEDDIQLVSEVFPTILKTYEMLHLSNPKHRGLAVMTGSLYIMYANVFVQAPADDIPETQFGLKNAGYVRAKKFYLRGSQYVLKSLAGAYPAFDTAIAAYSEKTHGKLLTACVKTDAESLYWAGSGILGAFALDPLDTDVLSRVSGAVAMLERAAALDPSFNDGAIWEVLAAFYAAAPDTLGGGPDKAEDAYQKALELSGGMRPSVHILYAESFCIPRQDSAGFDAALKRALDIDPATQPENRLAIAVSRKKALRLQATKEDFFLE